MSRAPVLSFIVPVRNDAVRLRRCLNSVAAAHPPEPYEIIVADNGSTDDSVDVARAAGAAVVSLPGRRVSDVRNQAAASARGDFLAFVDADHELGSGWGAAALPLFAEPGVWAVGADYHAPADGTWVQRMYDRFRGHDPGPSPTEWLPSGNLIVRRSAFDRLRGFDTSLESCEDVDFCRRLREAGGTLMQAGTLHSVHHGDPKTLRALFLAELWRGRDNLRVSLRERLTWRSLPSIAIPVLHLASAAGLLAALAVWSLGASSWWLVAPLVLSATLVAARTLRLATRGAAADTFIGGLGRAAGVAATYDAARALALIYRASHDVRRKG